MNFGRGAGDRRPARAWPERPHAGRLAAARLVAGVVAGGLALTSCAVEADAPEASPTPDEKLAAEAEVAAKNKGTTSKVGEKHKKPKSEKAQRPSKRDRPANDGGTNAATAGEPTAEGDGAKSGDSVDWDELARTGDGTRDHGNGPEYADITAFTVQDSGEHAMVRVTVAGVLPGRLVTGEVQGVGVDVFRSDDMESDYQVFFDGGTHGWRAFLQTPDGFVEFPGTFEVSGRTLTAVVPWESLGGREDASVSAFADWSSGVGRLSADGVPKTEVSVG